MKHGITGLVFVLATSLAPHHAQAQGHPGHMGHGDRMMKALDELDLTADQKKKLAEIKKTFKTNEPKHDAMRAAHEELKAALQGTASDAEVKKKFEAMKAAHDAFMEARFEKVLAIRAILTPEQRAKFKGLRGPGHGPDDGPGGPGDDD
jgi:Spy/CpxP family protein refolding chaperone